MSRPRLCSPGARSLRQRYACLALRPSVVFGFVRTDREGRSWYALRMAEMSDIAVVGAGAAGLFASIWAGRTIRASGLGGSGASVVAFDGAKKLGAKVLVAGGGRCNVTHHAVDETAYAGSSRNAIRKVLRGFGVRETVAFFTDMGVELKREETGKLFPITDDANTVLDALLRAAERAKVKLVHPWRVGELRREGDGFVLTRQVSEGEESVARTILARRVILAAGGMALPKTGSDGKAYQFVRALGHTVTPVFPALVPLVLGDASAWIKELSGLTVNATLELHSASGKKLVAFTNSTLCTHFGLSGPSVLDISRYYTEAKRADAGTKLLINWVPGVAFDAADAWLAEAPKVSAVKRLTEKMPERLARAICTSVSVDPTMQIGNLKRDARRALARQVVATELAVNGDRGFTYAEVTAGGVPLSELHLDTMESRICPGLHLCGEICDVDGRIGGFNFQWAWASGHAAGVAAARAMFAGPSTEGD